MKLRFAPLYLLMSAAIFAGCEKDNSGDDDQDDKTKTEMISASAWKYDNAKIDSDNNGEGDFDLPAGTLQACQTDNTLTFSAGGTGTIDEGAIKCNSTDPQTSPFTWAFANNETTINFTGNVFAGIGGEFKLLVLTETEMKLSKTINMPPTNVPMTIIATFKH